MIKENIRLVHPAEKKSKNSPFSTLDHLHDFIALSDSYETEYSQENPPEKNLLHASDRTEILKKLMSSNLPAKVTSLLNVEIQTIPDEKLLALYSLQSLQSCFFRLAHDHYNIHNSIYHGNKLIGDFEKLTETVILRTPKVEENNHSLLKFTLDNIIKNQNYLELVEIINSFPVKTKRSVYASLQEVHQFIESVFMDKYLYRAKKMAKKNPIPFTLLTPDPTSTSYYLCSASDTHHKENIDMFPLLVNGTFLFEDINIPTLLCIKAALTGNNLVCFPGMLYRVPKDEDIIAIRKILSSPSKNKYRTINLNACSIIWSRQFSPESVGAYKKLVEKLNA